MGGIIPLFYNTKQEVFTFPEMFARILKFIKEDPQNSYRIAIGTDSMVRTTTCFITAVLVHRVGKGAIGFLKKLLSPTNSFLTSKISYETTFSQEIAYLFTPELIDEIYETILQADQTKHLGLEIHIDIGPPADRHGN